MSYKNLVSESIGKIKLTITITLVCILLCHLVSAQQKPKKTYTVYINYPEYSVKTDVSNENKKIEADQNLTYYWYASNKIMETRGGCDGKILDGPYTSFYLSNNLKEKGNFKKGLKDGEWISWSDNGKIIEVINWKRGIKNGVYKTFDNKGNLILESAFKDGEVDGYQLIYENGKLISKKKFKNGAEVVAQPKTDSNEKSTTEQPKQTLKERFNSVFKKKDKKQEDEKKTEESTKETKSKKEPKEQKEIKKKKEPKETKKPKEEKEEKEPKEKTKKKDKKPSLTETGKVR